MGLQDEFDGLLGAEPRAVRMSAGDLVDTGPVGQGATEVLAVEPKADGIDLVGWARDNREWIEERFDRYGALLFRGFETGAVDRFERFSRVLAPELMEYLERSTPRSEVEGRVYTSTEYPSDQTIPLHNELSYGHRWPSRIWFYCVTPAEARGATPVADSRKVLEHIDPDVRRRFVERGLMYVRNYGSGPGTSWQEAFQTDSREEVESFCRVAGMEVEWRGDGVLRTRVRRPATVEHPVTGEEVWFNQAHLHHVSALAPEVRESLLASLDEDELPFNTVYGDGAPIEADDVRAVEAAYRETLTTFSWRRGDVLFLDNVLMAHGREPYVGPRRIVVTMA